MYAGHYPLDSRCDWYCGKFEPSLDVEKGLPLVCGFYCPIRCRVFLLAVNVEAPDLFLELYEM